MAFKIVEDTSNLLISSSPNFAYLLPRDGSPSASPPLRTVPSTTGATTVGMEVQQDNPDTITLTREELRHLLLRFMEGVTGDILVRAENIIALLATRQLAPTATGRLDTQPTLPNAQVGQNGQQVQLPIGAASRSHFSPPDANSNNSIGQTILPTNTSIGSPAANLGTTTTLTHFDNNDHGVHPADSRSPRRDTPPEPTLTDNSLPWPEANPTTSSSIGFGNTDQNFNPTDLQKTELNTASALGRVEEEPNGSSESTVLESDWDSDEISPYWFGQHRPNP